MKQREVRARHANEGLSQKARMARMTSSISNKDLVVGSKEHDWVEGVGDVEGDGNMMCLKRVGGGG